LPAVSFDFATSPKIAFNKSVGKQFDAGDLTMIKSLFEEDESNSEKIVTEAEKETPREPNLEETVPPLSADEMESLREFSETAIGASDLPDAPKSAYEETFADSFAETTGEPLNFSEPHFNRLENSSAETVNEPKNFASPSEIADETINYDSRRAAADETVNYESFAEIAGEKTKNGNADLMFQPLPEPESFAETARRSGLAYAAAITLFGSVVFMLIIGWFADLLLGSSPWGVVGGIVLGAAIGFFQFFRLTSQIFKNKD